MLVNNKYISAYILVIYPPLFVLPYFAIHKRTEEIKVFTYTSSVLLPESITPLVATWRSPETRPIMVLLPERLIPRFSELAPSVLNNTF